MNIVDHLDWVVACLGLVTSYLIGNNNRWGWMLSIVNQFIWLYLSWQHAMYGFIVFTVVKLYQSVLYFYKWGATNECSYCKSPLKSGGRK